ncbi:MAG: sigma-54 dependent transcriptional regulator [Acidobacteriota bacterium]
MALCLVVEDDPDESRVLAGALRAGGHQVLCARDGRSASEICHLHRPELVLLDLGLPDIDGMSLIPTLIRLSPFSRVVVLTGLDSVRASVAALRAGARHYLVKPWDLEELLLIVERESRSVDSNEVCARERVGSVFWGTHPAMTRLRRQLEKLSGAPTTPVFIEGETGSGKEVIARELHRLTADAKEFLALNCAAIPGELLESELFGHERGAFTGAEMRRRGLVELARDGTLFLDEVSETPPSLQAKLLRFLQDHRFRRVGGEVELSAPSRVVAATHRDVDALVQEGRFRNDLFYRLAVVRLKVPPLCARRDDLLPLAYFLIQTIARTLGRAPRQLTPSAEQAVLDHDWPGNVRELKNRLERATVLGEGEYIQHEDLDLPGSPPRATQRPAAGKTTEQLSRVLEAERWNISKAARRLGVERHWLRYRLKKMGLSRPVDR